MIVVPWASDKRVRGRRASPSVPGGFKSGLFGGCAGSSPASTKRGDDGTAEIRQTCVGKRGAIRGGVQGAEKSFQEAAQGVEFFAQGEMESAAVGADDEKRYVIGCQIFREALRDFADERGDQLLGGDLAEKIGDA